MDIPVSVGLVRQMLWEFYNPFAQAVMLSICSLCHLVRHLSHFLHSLLIHGIYLVLGLYLFFSWLHFQFAPSLILLLLLDSPHLLIQRSPNWTFFTRFYHAHPDSAHLSGYFKYRPGGQMSLCCWYQRHLIPIVKAQCPCHGMSWNSMIIMICSLHPLQPGSYAPTIKNKA